MLRTGKPLSVELGPGIMGSIFDGEYRIGVATCYFFWWSLFLAFIHFNLFDQMLLYVAQCMLWRLYYMAYVHC